MLRLVAADILETPCRAVVAVDGDVMDVDEVQEEADWRDEWLDGVEKRGDSQGKDDTFTFGQVCNGALTPRSVATVCEI